MDDTDALIIGNRRWRVWLSRRTDTNDLNSANLTQKYETIAQVWASIVPVSTMTFYETTQTDQAITHRMFMRWRTDMRLFDYVLRNGVDPNGKPISEVFQIRRSSDWQGRKRFLMIDLRLEERAL